jgi:putative Mn2+ efflux pump MntP
MKPTDGEIMFMMVFMGLTGFFMGNLLWDSFLATALTMILGCVMGAVRLESDAQKEYVELQAQENQELINKALKHYNETKGIK